MTLRLATSRATVAPPRNYRGSNLVTVDCHVLGKNAVEAILKSFNFAEIRQIKTEMIDRWGRSLQLEIFFCKVRLT